MRAEITKEKPRGRLLRTGTKDKILRQSGKGEGGRKTPVWEVRHPMLEKDRMGRSTAWSSP